jgi:hypothetical protein
MTRLQRAAEVIYEALPWQLYREGIPAFQRFTDEDRRALANNIAQALGELLDEARWIGEFAEARAYAAQAAKYGDLTRTTHGKNGLELAAVETKGTK